MESLSLNLDLDNNEDEDDIEDRQNEIQGLLSTAFDDLSSLSEDEDECNSFKKFTISCDNTNDNKYKSNYRNKWPKDTNGLTSTPRLLNRSDNRLEDVLWTKTNGKVLNVSDIPEEEGLNGQDSDGRDGDYEDNSIDEFCANALNSKTNGQFDSKNSSLENGRTEQSVNSLQTKPVFGTTERSFNGRHVQSLIEENQRLSNELIVSQQKLLTTNGNYEGLQYRLKELEQINAQKENQLIRLEAQIKSLELTINVERVAKQEFQRKVSVCESTIESLEYQLMEIGKSDCLVRAQETHQSVVDRLKSKYENQLILFKGEIDGLKHELNSKNSEIIVNNEELNRLKAERNENSFSQQFKDMIKVTKDLWEQEMKVRVENDIKTIIELHEKKWTKSAEQELISERNKWEKELQTEVIDIIELLKIKARVSAGSLPQQVGLRFVPLLNLWRALEESCDSKEQTLRVQTERLREAKIQLEDALNESRLNRSVSPTNGAANDDLFSELRTELQKVSEEALEMKHKLNKYKQHYHQLVRRHKQEIERIKQEFAHILEALKRDLK